MDKELFINLDLNQRAEFVWQSGEFISTINYYGFRINLYVVGDSYVEVFYNVHNNQIEEVELLDPEEKRLGLYTNGVNLSTLFK